MNSTALDTVEVWGSSPHMPTILSQLVGENFLSAPWVQKVPIAYKPFCREGF